MKDLTSKDIPLLIAIIIYVIVRDTWSLVTGAIATAQPALWSLSKPHAIAGYRYTKAKAIAAIASLCRLASDKLLSIYIDVDEEGGSFCSCLDAIAYAVVRDVGVLLGFLADWLVPEVSSIQYFVE